MNNKIFSQFNLYDQFGYLLVGSIALLIIYFDSVILKIRLPSLTLINLTILIVIAYFLGHLIQAMANIFVKEKKESFSEKEKGVLEKARNYFNVEKASDKEIWDLCYMLALAKDITRHVQTFSALYGLYRGWTFIFVLESFFLAGFIIYSFSLLKLGFLVISLITTILLFQRLRRFGKYFRDKVFQTFILIKTLEKSKENNQ